jgi:hypothetical protein
MRKSFANLGEAKYRVANQTGLFRMFSQNSEKLIFKRKWCTKRSETKQKEAKKGQKK